MSGSSSVGRVSAFQADCREFESRLPLIKKSHILYGSFLLAGMTVRLELQVRKHLIEFGANERRLECFVLCKKAQNQNTELPYNASEQEKSRLYNI